LITLSGQRVTVGQASTNLVSLKHDAIRLALACRLGKPRVCLVDTGCGQSQWHLSQWRNIAAERVLRSGDELRVGNSRLIFWEVKQADEASANQATVSVKTAQVPRLTRLELEVLVVLCRPLVSDDPFPEPASVRRMALERFVPEAAIKQHLQNLYDKFAIPSEGDRRVRLANEAIRRGAVTLTMSARQRYSSRQRYS